MLFPVFSRGARAPVPGHRRIVGTGIMHATENAELVAEVRRRKQQIADFIGDEIRVAQ